MPLSIEVKLMDDKEVENEKLVMDLIKSSKSQEDKLTAARLACNQDNQKAANAIKDLMNKK